MSSTQWCALIATAIVSWAIAGVVRKYMLAHTMLDIPNHRSSHTIPTPRGGGIAIAAVTIVMLILAAALHWIDWPLAIAAAGGGSIVAGIGGVDDRRHVRAPIRAAAHALAALWMLVWLGGLPRLSFGTHSIPMGLLGSGLAVIGVVWLINLYNFMDGIDGIAGGEAVIVATAAGCILLFQQSYGLAFVAFLITAAVIGFLIWNWPPAKLFMGDVGSGLLGFLFATLAIASENRGGLPVWAWIFLLLVFVSDTTITLIRRLLRGDRVYEAHRDHAYQRAVQAGNKHGTVTVLVCLVTLVLALLLTAGRAYPAWMPFSITLGLAMVIGLYIFTERLYSFARSQHHNR